MGLSAFLAAWFTVLSMAPAFCATPLPVSVLPRTSAVHFEKEILPILQRNCLACHNQTRAKADLVLESPASILKGGANGPAAIPGKAAESLLFRSAAHQVDDLVMPPIGNKSNAANLSPDELGLLALWINQGAQGEVGTTRKLAWRPIPDSWSSSYAVAVDRDGHLVACARANRVQIYDARTGRPAGQLADPDLNGATQRDVVHSLAFSPSEDLLATAGYREVRMWRRQPAITRELVRSEESSTWVSAVTSADRTLIALVTSGGDVQLRRSDTGALITTWPAVTSPPARLAFAPDATRIAVIGASGVLRLLPVSGGAPTHEQALGAEALAVVWYDLGQALATVFHAAKTIQTWRFPERPEADQLVPGPNLSGHDAHITCMAADPAGGLVSGAADGRVLLWKSDGTEPPTALPLEAPVTRLSFIGPTSRFAAGLATGGSALLAFNDQPTQTNRLRGDPRLTADAEAAAHDLERARLELSFSEKSIQEAEGETKKSAEVLAQAREKRDAHAKAFAEKEDGLAQQQQAEKVAAKERDDLAAELQRALGEAASSEKAASDAQASAREAVERSVASQLAADQSGRLKLELERIVDSLAGSAAEDSVSKAREAAQAASAEFASSTSVATVERARADEALKELSRRAFFAGEKKAVADRANAEIPSRKKQAEERIAAASKAINELQSQREKARIALDGGDKDIQIAEQTSLRARTTLEDAKQAAAIARERIAQSEQDLNERKAHMLQAEKRLHVVTDAVPSGDRLLSVDADGAAMAWDLASGVASFAFQGAARPPLALLAMGDGAALVVDPRAITHVDFEARWEHVRTLGNDDGSGSEGTRPFLDRVNALAFSPDGTLLATGGGEPSRSGELKVWRTTDGSLVRDFGPVHSDCVLAVAFSPRGQFLATGGADRFARISEVATGRRIHNLEGHTHHVMAVAWLAHGGTLATAGAEGTLKVWNVRTGERLKNVEGFGKEITGLGAVGISDQFVAVAGGGHGRILRGNGEKVRDLPGTAAYYHALALSRDGKWAAVAADDGVLRIWDVETAVQRFALSPPVANGTP